MSGKIVIGTILVAAAGFAFAGLNEREKVFYHGKQANEDGHSGVRPHPVTGFDQLLDPQGRPYYIILDGDSDGIVSVPHIGDEQLLKKCGVFSQGKNLKITRDDICSWQ